jgi:hypothetical protein
VYVEKDIGMLRLMLNDSISARMKTPLRTAVLLVPLFLLVQCSDPTVIPDPFPTAYDGAQFDTDRLATQWYECASVCMDEQPSIADPIAARVYAYMGIALYQALVPGMPEYRSLQTIIPALGRLPFPDTAGKRYHWALAANAALAQLLRGILPNLPSTIRRIDSLEAANIAERWIAERDTEMLERSIQYGKALAEHLLQFAAADGGDGAWKQLFPLDYQLPPTSGVWEPTSPDAPVPLLPQWATVRTLVARDTSIDPPPPYSTDTSSQFYRAAKQIHRRRAALTVLQLDDARYWANPFGRPPSFPSHLMRIVTQLVRSGPYRMGFGAVLYLRVGIAMHDGYVLAWKAKYRYPLLRPETYIRRVIDPTYIAPIQSPPTPEYLSDHALIATAVVRILQDVFANPFPRIERITDRTHVVRGMLERDYRGLEELMSDILHAEQMSCTQYDFSIETAHNYGERLAAEILGTVRVQ